MYNIGPRNLKLDRKGKGKVVEDKVEEELDLEMTNGEEDVEDGEQVDLAMFEDKEDDENDEDDDTLELEDEDDW